MGKEAFKQFVHTHPNLAGYVARGDMTWQKFYEMYDLYGENSVIWDPYQVAVTPPITNVNKNVSTKKQETSWKDLVQMVKGIDLASVQKGIDGMQKAIGLVQEFTTKKAPTNASTYEPRPLYRYFED